MASKGPSTKAPAAAAQPAIKVAAKSTVAKPTVVKAEPKSAPVAAKAATKPVAPSPAPLAETKPIGAASPVPVAKPAPVAVPAPVVSVEPLPPAPVITPVQAETLPPEPVVATAAAVIKKEVVTMEATLKSAAEKVQAQAKTLFGDVNDRTKTAMEKGSKMIEEMNEFSKGNVEALVESSKIAAKGVETLGQEAAEYSRKQFESATATMKSLSTVKSPTDFFKLQSDYFRSAFDSLVAETSKNSETMLKLAGEIAQPISNRVAVAAEKIKIAA